MILILENGKGKEYNLEHRIIFEGEYFDGRRWNGIGYNFGEEIDFEIKYGKGVIKEYDYYDHLIFEGEYLNGYRNGKGKEYYSNTKIKFEGLYLNGKKITGNKYDIDGNIILILQNGKGKEINSLMIEDGMV